MGLSATPSNIYKRSTTGAAEGAMHADKHAENRQACVGGSWTDSEHAHTVALLIQKLGSAEIGDLHVHVLAEQDVLRLEVAVNNTAAVHVLQGKDNFRDVEAGALLVEGA